MAENITNKIMEKKLGGSFTIELSIIMMVVFSSIILVMGLAIYLHDMSVMKGIANEGVAVGENIINGYDGYHMRVDGGIYWNTTIDNYAKGEVVRWINYKVNHLLLDKGEYIVQVKVSNRIVYREVKVSIRKEYHHFLYHFICNMIGNEKITMEIESKKKVYRKTEVVRNIDFLDEVTDDILPIKEYKKQYKETIKSLEDVLEIIFMK